ncbi:hypothetical protein OC835_005283 [Tilletia horrida]|nr:hypothetical protein OC835_005283 [Tilletia horrida]
MSQPGAAAAAQGGGAVAGRGGGGGGGGGGRAQAEQPDWRWTILRAVFVYLAMQLVLQKFMPTAPTNKTAGNDGDASKGQSASPSAAASQGPQLPASVALWDTSDPLDLYVFLAEALAPSHLEILTQYSQYTHYGMGPYAHSLDVNIDFSAQEYQALLGPSPPHASQPIRSVSNARRLPAVKFPGITLDNSKLDLRLDLGEFPISDSVRTGNSSLWAEIFLCANRSSPNPADPSHTPMTVHRQRKLLTRLFARKKRRVERNLFDKSNETLAEFEEEEDDFDEKNPPIGAHWHRNLTLALVPFANQERIQLAQEPPPSLQFIFPVLDPAQSQQAAHIAAFDPSMRFRLPTLTQESLTGEPSPVPLAYHYPVIFPNDFWLLRGHMNPINRTVHSLPLSINLYATTPWKFKIQSNMNEGWERAQNGQATGLAGQAGSSEIDMLKSVLLETSPWWLALTIFVSILHSVFELLAFSSDIGDWRKRDNLAGISLGSIMTNVVTQIIVLLYLLDASEETSFMIIMSQAAGAAIEAWKLTKVIKIAVVRTPSNARGLLALLPYQIKILNKRVMSEEEKKTAEYDRLAFKIVGSVMIPLLTAYAVYSAIYHEHKGWWSYIITTLTTFTFGMSFTSLIPQLIVNYRCKSTAGFTSKTLIFKILSTVVDDFFAFAIPQPTLHRLACFRDDVVFVIFLYQRWLYGVDPTRRNELGEIVDKEGAKRKELEAAAAAAAGKDGKADAGAAEQKEEAEATTTAVEKNAGAGSTSSRKKGGGKQ